MADLKKSIKDEMNSTPNCIPAKWNRYTVADGDWMQAKTIDQLMNRDDFLADKIGESSSAWQNALSSESATRYSDDQYLSASLTALSGEFTSFSANEFTKVSGDLYKEVGRAKDAENTLTTKITNEAATRSATDADLYSQIDKLKAATDVIAVFGTYDEFVAGSGDLGVTDNDTIKVLRDYNYTPPSADEDYESNDNDGFQVYYEWHISAHDGWNGWSAIGSLDPYYSVSEIDEYLEQIDDEFDSLSATVANNYLSASTDAVKEGHNIKVTEQTGPVIEIATKDNVDFTELSADMAWIDTISADVSAFDFYETTSGKRLSETQQGLLINTTISPFDPTVSASEGDIFWPANFEQIFSAWYDTDKLINIKYTNDNITRLYTLNNVRQYTEDDFTYYDLNFISNDDKVAYTAYAKVKRNGGEGGGAPEAPVLYDCDEGPIDVEYTGEHGVYVSGDHKVGLSGTYETALKEGSAASAWINDNESKIAYTADFKGTNGVVTGYGTSAFAGGISSISAKTGDSTALFTGYNVNLQAGEGVGFSYGTNLLTISAEGKTYSSGDYISITGDTNKINVTGTLINSAQSGQSAYNWITTKSATLQAGQGIGFYSAGPNTLGISASVTACGLSSISVPGSVFTGRNVDFSAGSNIYFTTANNKIGINLDDNLSLGNTNRQINIITETEDADSACIVIRHNNLSQLQLYNNYITRDSKHTTWDKVISASNGMFGDLTATSFTTSSTNGSTTAYVEITPDGVVINNHGTAAGSFVQISPTQISNGNGADTSASITNVIRAANHDGYISGDGTITALVSASQAGSTRGVLYFV